MRRASLVLEVLEWMSWYMTDDDYGFGLVSDSLLLARADHRVIVCQGYSGSMEDAFLSLASRVERYKMTQVGDRYLLVLFDLHTRKFESQVYVARKIW